MKRIFKNIILAVFLICCFLSGIFYLHAGFWKNDMTRLGGILLIAFTSICVISAIQMTLRKSRTCRIIYISTKLILAVMQGIIGVCWLVLIGGTFFAFSKTMIISPIGVIVHLTIMMIGVILTKLDFHYPL